MSLEKKATQEKNPQSHTQLWTNRHVTTICTYKKSFCVASHTKQKSHKTTICTHEKPHEYQFVRTDGRTDLMDSQTDWTSHIAAWSQLKK